MNKDPHSAEGYYEMTWFYGNSVNNKWLERYPAIYSSSQNDMPTYSDIGTTYHKDCPSIGGWAACYSGGSDSWRFYDCPEAVGPPQSVSFCGDEVGAQRAPRYDERNSGEFHVGF